MALPIQETTSDNKPRARIIGGLSCLPVFSPLKMQDELVKFIFAPAKPPLPLGKRVTHG